MVEFICTYMTTLWLVYPCVTFYTVANNLQITVLEEKQANTLPLKILFYFDSLQESRF